MEQVELQCIQHTETCIYCQSRASTDNEHVIPRLLFDEKPTNPVTVPSCRQCNAVKSDFDQYFRDVLVWDWLGMQHPTGRTIFEGKFKRAVGRNQSVLMREFVHDSMIQEAIANATSPDQLLKFQPDWSKVTAELEYMTKGLSYSFHKSPVPEEMHFDSLRIGQFDHSRAQEYLDMWGAEKFVEMGKHQEFVAYRVKMEGHARNEMWCLLVYDSAMFCCALIHPDSPGLNEDILQSNPAVPNLIRMNAQGR